MQIKFKREWYPGDYPADRALEAVLNDTWAEGELEHIKDRIENQNKMLVKLIVMLGLNKDQLLSLLGSGWGEA